MSLAEKKKHALDFIISSKNVFTPRELPQLFNKHKSISRGAGEKVLAELESDDLIHVDKIGASNYVWAFKSEKTCQMKNKLKKMEDELNEIEENIPTFDEKLKTAKDERQEPDREKAIPKLKLVDESNQQKREEIESLSTCDAGKYKEIIAGLETAKQIQEMWTDNVYSLIKFIKAKKSCTEKEILQFIGLSSDFDYIE